MSFSLALTGAIVDRSRRWQNASGLGQMPLEASYPLVNEGSALSVQRTSSVCEFNVDGSEKQAAVELIDRCLSSRAVQRIK